MFLNEVKGVKVFKCKSKIIMNYFVYEKHLPVFSIRDGIYHFIYNENLKKILKNLPIWINLLVIGEGLNKNLDK